MRFLKIILSVFALFYRLTPNYLIISDVYFLHRQVGRENKRKQIETIWHIALRISDLRNHNLRSNNGSNSVPELCSYLIISVLDALHREMTTYKQL